MLSLERLREVLVAEIGDRAECFLTAGLAAVANSCHRWVQVGVAPPTAATAGLYGALDDLSTELLAEPGATNFFFMHKPPGLRLRFETTPADRWSLEARLHARVAALDEVERVEPGFYEPEEQLFGGPAAMRFVHKIFTVDSRAWLAFHRLGSDAPTWAYSLALVRHLLAGLGVVGWEDIGVWDRIGRQAGRRLPAGMNSATLEVACAGIRAGWSDPDGLRAGLPAPVRALADEWGPRLRTAAEEWATGYFATRAAVIGPREGAALLTIFHWNRGGLSSGTQALVTAALADRPAPA